jgi:aspartyl-tRNA(Asn)/glutamyl-tRNA(Gln) amidotransferase subunit C
VIDREEVLHVARLARLRLREEEIAQLAGELSAVLEHVARIGELDLEGVEPMAHVVSDDLPPAHGLREDVPRTCLPREVALAQAPAVSDGGFSVPSPQA